MSTESNLEVYGFGNQFVLVWTSGKNYYLHIYKQPYIKGVEVNCQNDIESVSCFSGKKYNMLRKLANIDISIDLTVYPILSDGSPGYIVMSGEGDWKKYLDLFQDFTIADLFREINKKIDKEDKNVHIIQLGN